MAELEVFLAPIAGPQPAGIELRNDGRFHAIERLLEPASRAARQAQVDQGGNGVIQVDWAGVIDQAAGLAAEGRDLRLLVIVTRALANDSGFAGLADGIGMLSEVVTRHWADLHPALRDNPSRREAATRRINALLQLENADNGLLCDLEFAPALTFRPLGTLTGADLAAGQMNSQAVLAMAPGGSEKEKAALLAAHEARANRVRAATRALAAEQPETMAEITAGVGRARTALAALEAALDGQVAENGIGVRFENLGAFLARIQQTLAAAPAAAAPTATEGGAATGQAAPMATQTGGVNMDRVNSRSDVERMLDLIIDFYERTEPSSPIPHLARRMRKMVPMNFMQLMEEIAPSGMKEFRNVAGVTDAKQ